MLFFEMPPRVFSTATKLFWMPSDLPSPALTAALEANSGQLAVSERPKAANIGEEGDGCGVGIEALGSPMGAATIDPPLMTRSGLAPKNAGDHSTRSASLFFSTEPMILETPCAMAGLIVYLAT